MQINCTSAENISLNISSAQRGYHTYKKIWKKYHSINSYASTLVLIFPDDDESLFNDCINIVPHRLKQLERKNFYTITTRNYEINKLNNKKYLGNTVISSNEMQDLLKSFQLMFLNTNCIIVSLNYPYGRNASNLMISGTVTKNNILLDCLLNPIRGANKKAFFKEYLIMTLMGKLRSFILDSALYFNTDFIIYLFYNQVIYRGQKKYEELSQIYPDSLLALAPYQGTGDVFLAVAMLNKWQEMKKIPHIQTVVIGGANKRICSLFNINALSISKKDMHALVRFCIFVGLDNSHTKILHHGSPKMQISIMDLCRNVKELNFFNMYLYGVYNTTNRNLYEQATFNNDKDAIHSIFEENHLIPGRTILIAPKNNTLPPIKSSFWRKLVSTLKQMGYTVCTNVASPNEKPLKGTTALFVPYSQIVPFLDEAGHFLSIRSGLCDIVSSSNCDKVILYRSGFKWNNKDSFDYFSLKEMGLCDNPTELCYTNKTLDLLQQQIIEHYS